MDQIGVANSAHRTKRKQIRREKLLTGMEQVTPWQRLETRVELFYRLIGDHPPCPLSGMLTIHLFQHRDGLSDLTMEDTLYEFAFAHRFAGQLSLICWKNT